MENPVPDKVSIIMPTYNRAHLLSATLESILEQTYTNWELIVIDDGSEDNTSMLMSTIHDSRIAYHRIPHSGALHAVRNSGIALSNGAYIAFIDSDDLWHAQKLEKQVNILQKFPEAGFCLTNGYNFIEPGEPVEFFYRQHHEEIPCDLFHGCFRSEVACFSQTLLFRRNCLEKTGLLENDPNTDRRFIVSLALDFKGVILYEPLVYRRIHVSNMNYGRWKNSYLSEEEMIMKYKPALERSIYQQALFRLYIQFGEALLANREKRKALQVFGKAFQLKPGLSAIKKMGKALIHAD